MSWADDIRCLYCDGRLPLYRKITNGQFCSAAHRKSYWHEQERLAVERLHQTHDSLQAYKPRVPVESILGNTEASIELPAELPAEVVIESFEPKAEPRPVWLTFANSGDVPVGSFVRDSARMQARWPADRILVYGEMLAATIVPRSVVGLFRPSETGLASASLIAIPRFTPILTESRILAPSVAATIFTTLRKLEKPALLFTIDPGRPVEILQDSAPLSEKLFALARMAASAGHSVPMPLLIEPLVLVVRVHLPLWMASVREAGLVQAGRVPALPLDRVAIEPGLLTDSLRALDLRAGVGAPELALFTPPVRPRLRLATGRRYPVDTPGDLKPSLPADVPAARIEPGPLTDNLRASDLRASVEAAELALSTSLVRPRLRLATGRRYPVDTPGDLKPTLPAGVAAERIEPAAMSVTLPQREAKVIRAAAGATASAPAFEPGPAGLLRLECTTAPSNSVSVRAVPDVLSMPQPPSTEPMRPASRLEPHVDFMANPPASAVMSEGEFHDLRANVWKHTIDFWNRAPRDLKMLAFAIPILFGLALHPALPKVRVAAPMAASGLERNVKNVVDTQLASFKQTVFDRAAIALDEDFRSGLDDWASRGDVATEWSFDATGFVRPGALALYRPSMNLTDYQVQFLGMIDQKALSWVVRAADFDNYQVVKLEVIKPGPLPTIGLTRYAVVNGKADARADVIAPIDARNDMLYRVRIDVRGDEFALTVQGQLIDAWSEPRLARGGIGFFSAHGEASRLRWVQVTHQYDMLGRLCAYLAPYNIPSTTGSLEP